MLLILRRSVFYPSHQLLNQLTDFHENWYRGYVTRKYPNAVLYDCRKKDFLKYFKTYRKTVCLTTGT